MTTPTAEQIEAACEVMHDAYEAAAIGAGWETQQESRKPWADVPDANKETKRAAVAALLDHLAEVRAAEWQAGRLPSEDDIARVLALTDDYDGCFERMDAWSAATDEQQLLGLVEEPLSTDPEDCEFWLTRARAVLALLTR